MLSIKEPIEMLGLDKDLYSRTTIYIPGLDNIRKTRCVLSLINPINKMYAMLASLKKKTNVRMCLFLCSAHIEPGH
jgi:hypothetical protein